jgi:hypothetical protein
MFEIFKLSKSNKIYKKGSLELSVNAIIIVVLAMTLLGLGLGFIRSMFKNIGETVGTVQETVKQQILEDLRTGDKKLSFPTQEVLIGKKESKDLAVGIKNTNPGTLYYKLNLSLVLKDGDELSIRNRDAVIMSDKTNVGIFIWNPAEQKLDINAPRVEPIKFIAGSYPDTYIIKITAIEVPYTPDLNDNTKLVRGTETEYDSKSFFLTIA